MSNEPIPNLVLAIGPEPLLADRAIDRILSGIRLIDPLAALQSLSASDIDVGEIGDALAPSLFDEQRVLVIRDLQDLNSDCASEITNYLASANQFGNLRVGAGLARR